MPPDPAPFLCSAQKFWKVSALVYLLYSVSLCRELLKNSETSVPSYICCIVSLCREPFRTLRPFCVLFLRTMQRPFENFLFLHLFCVLRSVVRSRGAGLKVCVCVCVCVCTHTHTHTYIHPSIELLSSSSCVCVHTYLRYVCVCAHIHTHAQHTHTHTSME